MELSRRGVCRETGSFGRQTVSSGAFAARSEDGTIVRPGLAPKDRPNAGYGALSLRDAEMAANEIDEAGSIGTRRCDGRDRARL